MSLHLNNADIRLTARFIHRNGCNAFHPILNGICNVWYNLYGLSEVITTTFAFDYIPVNFAGSNVVFAGQRDVEKTFIISKIEIDFPSVVENKNFSCNIGISNERLIMWVTATRSTS